MLTAIGAFSGFSVDDKEKAKAFYGDVLGLSVEDNGMGLKISLQGGGYVFAYAKSISHVPATFTILNFVVENIDAAKEELEKSGVIFEMYEEIPHDEKGIVRGLANNRGPDIAWFKDPAGNVLSILQDK